MDFKGSDLSRRAFLVGATALGAGLGLTACAPSGKSTGESKEGLSNTGEALDWLGTEPTIADEDIVETVETDFLIVGSGTGGLFAACAAGEEGLSTIVLDKAQGSVVRDDVGAIDSKLQKADDCVIDRNKFMADMMSYATGYIDPELYRVWMDNSADLVDWYESVLAEKGITLWHEDAKETHETLYRHYPTGHSPAWPEDGSMTATSFLTDYANETGYVEFRYNTPMVKLIVENEKVVGVIAEGEEGYLRVTASKGVLMATGGYGSNTEMMKALQPETLELFSSNYGPSSCTGDGIRACLWAGAAMDTTHTSMLFDRDAVAPDGLGGYECDDREMFWMGTQPFLKVNLNGKRFCNESTPYDYILHADSGQPGRLHVTIWDSDYQTYAEQFDMHGCSRLFPFDNGAPPNMPIVVIEAMNKDLIDRGYIQQADTLEELAEKLGLPVEAFVETVARNNENYDNQYDPDFFKEPFRLSPVRKAPFFGARNTGNLLCTMDGIKINTKAQALRPDGTVIEGLYVTGNDSGGFFFNTYPNLSTGLAAGRTATFARMVAKDLAKS